MTREQFEHIYAMENDGYPSDTSWYGYKLQLGIHEGIPVMTATNRGVVDQNGAGRLYLEVLKEGMMENYPLLDEKSIDDYLRSRNRGKQEVI